MKKTLLKTLSLILLLFTTLTIASCELPQSSTYKIEYYINGELQDLQPSIYEKDEIVEFPVIEDESFDGWYLSKTNKDNVVKSTEGFNQNLKLYGYIDQEEVYSIEYYINGEKVNLAPSSYKKNQVVSFPSVSLEYDEIFKGWYLSSSKQENEINSTEGLSQNLKLYGYIEKVENTNLEDIFSYDNFSYDLEYVYDGEYYYEGYKVDKDNLSADYDGVVTSFVNINGKMHCFFEENGTSYYLTEDDGDYAYIEVGYYFLDLSSVDLTKIIKVEGEKGIYQVSEDYIDEFGLIFTGYEEDYSFVEIYIYNNLLDKILLESTDQYGINTRYELTFSNYGTTVVTYDKNAIYYGSSSYEETYIEDVYDMSTGSVTTISGIVTGVYGNNFYIQDETASILVYLGSNSEYSDLIQIGENLTLTGTVEVYKTIHQIKEVTSIGYSYYQFEKHVEEKTSVAQSTLKSSVGSIVSYDNLTIKSLPSSYPTSSQDVSFKVTDGTNTVTVFISKHLDTASKNIFFNVLKTLNVGDSISIESAYISYYNEYQLVIVDGSTLNEEDINSDLSQDAIPSFRYESDRAPLLDALDYHAYVGDDGNTYSLTKGLPSTGEVKVLVIPVLFKNETVPANLVENINKAFFGTSNDTGWESLSSYYYKSSYGTLNITGTVLEPYSTGNTVRYYDDLYSQYLRDYDAYLNYETDVYPDPVEYEIIKEMLEYYDSTVNYDDYDSDGDGYIDSLYIIYVNEYSMDDESMWWAYTDEYLTEDIELYDNVETDFYTFISYYFFLDEFYGNNINLNTETIIHETGHLLGLDDYYDYDDTDGPDGGLGGGDMMDYNVGDHNAYSKAILGWINPYIVSGTDTTYELGKFVDTGDAIFIFKNYNGTLFDEFLIIDYYTPTSINEAQSGNHGLFSESGIRIYHVDATLSQEEAYSVFEMTKYNNSYTSKKLISIIEADGNNTVLRGDYSESSDLFQVNDVLNSFKWNDGTSINFTITINSIDSNTAKITIDYK